MEEGSPRKTKRTADRQLSKDDPAEDEDEHNNEAPGTFQRASAEVLKARRIIKGRGAKATAGASISPFSSSVSPEPPASEASSNPFTNIQSSSDAGEATLTSAGGTNPVALPDKGPAIAPAVVPIPKAAANPFQSLVAMPSESVTAVPDDDGPSGGMVSSPVAADGSGVEREESVNVNGINLSAGGSDVGGDSGAGGDVGGDSGAGVTATAAQAPPTTEATATKDDSAHTPFSSSPQPGDGNGEGKVVLAAAVTAANKMSAESAATAATEGGGVSTENGSKEETEGQASPVLEKNGVTGEGNVLGSSAGGSRWEEKGDGEAGKDALKVAGGSGVVSFATFGAGASPFQSLAKGPAATGAASMTPLSFMGFGSSSMTASLSTPPGSTPNSIPTPPFGTSLGGNTPISTSATPTTTAAALNGSVKANTVSNGLSFGSSTGKASSFASFTSFSAPGASWGLAGSSGAVGSGVVQKNGGEEGAASSGGTGSSGVSNKPPLELMDPSDVVNGEEMEECTHKTRAKLFRLADKEWVEMGIGFMKVLRKTDAVKNDKNGAAATGGAAAAAAAAETNGTAKGVSARLVMRREAGQQVILNVSLQAQMRCSNQGEKVLLLTCFMTEGPANYLLKFKTSEDATNLKAAINLLMPIGEKV